MHDFFSSSSSRDDPLHPSKLLAASVSALAGWARTSFFILFILNVIVIVAECTRSFCWRTQDDCCFMRNIYWKKCNCRVECVTGNLSMTKYAPFLRRSIKLLKIRSDRTLWNFTELCKLFASNIERGPFGRILVELKRCTCTRFFTFYIYI